MSYEAPAIGQGWRKFTIPHTSLQTASLTNNIEIFQLQPGELLDNLIMRHTAPFTGGSIISYTLSIGIAGSLLKYLTSTSVFGAAPNVPTAQADVDVLESFVAPVSVRLAAVSVGANLSASTGGSVDIYIRTATMF